MKFDKGILGVVIVVIALFGTIFAGYILNVQEETVSVNEYNRVTDVTSLFQFSEQPDYVEYNPAKNYTGYSYLGTSGVDYTPSVTTNQYLMDASSIGNTTIDTTSSLTNAFSHEYLVLYVNGQLCYSFGATSNSFKKISLEDVLGRRTWNKK